MAVFCYVHPKTKKVIEHFAPCGKAPKKIRLDDGTTAKRCLAAEVAGQGGQETTTWPVRSQALAVHPSQRKEYEKFAADHGVPTEFDHGGCPVFRTKEHRKNYAELVGATDMDGGCGDPFCG